MSTLADPAGSCFAEEKIIEIVSLLDIVVLLKQKNRTFLDPVSLFEFILYHKHKKTESFTTLGAIMTADILCSDVCFM